MLFEIGGDLTSPSREWSRRFARRPQETLKMLWVAPLFLSFDWLDIWLKPCFYYFLTKKDGFLEKQTLGTILFMLRGGLLAIWKREEGGLESSPKES